MRVSPKILPHSTVPAVGDCGHRQAGGRRYRGHRPPPAAAAVGKHGNAGTKQLRDFGAFRQAGFLLAVRITSMSASGPALAKHHGLRRHARGIVTQRSWLWCRTGRQYRRYGTPRQTWLPLARRLPPTKPVDPNPADPLYMRNSPCILIQEYIIPRNQGQKATSKKGETGSPAISYLYTLFSLYFSARFIYILSNRSSAPPCRISPGTGSPPRRHSQRAAQTARPPHTVSAKRSAPYRRASAS